MGTNVPGRTTKEVTELINQQGFDEKYGMVFTEDIVKGAKSRYGFKSGTPMGNPKGYSSKYPEGMAEYVASIAQGKSTAELVEAVNRKYGAGTIGIRQMKAYKKNHGINTGLTGQFEPGSTPANKGKKMSPEAYEKCAPTMFRKGQTPVNHKPVGTESVRRNYKRNQMFVYVKVAEPNIWRMKHIMEWEKHNGPVPKMGSYMSMSGMRRFFTGKDEYQCSQEEKEEAANKVAGLSMEHQMLLVMSSGLDNEGDVYDYYLHHNAERCEGIKAAYAVLEKYGWSFTEEESQILNGTHEFYVPEEKKEGEK